MTDSTTEATEPMEASPAEPQPAEGAQAAAQAETAQAETAETTADATTAQGPQADIGVTGLATMGRNLARNLARHGHTVGVHNRTQARTDALVAELRRRGHVRPGRRRSTSSSPRWSGRAG